MAPDVTGPGRQLHDRFVALGDFKGKTAEEIIAAVGTPTSRSSMTAGQTLLQWMATGYHIAILFGPDGRAVQVTHEFANFRPAQGCATSLLVTLGIVAAMALVFLVVSQV